MLRHCPFALPPWLLVSLALAVGAAAEEARADVDPSPGPKVAAAVEDVAARLEDPGCAAVLSDFTDSRTGATLAEGLAATGRTAAEHVRSLLFRGAPGLRPFGGRRVFAYTTPMSPVVLVCRDALLRVQNQRVPVGAIVLHEVLHTLGLRDDHPSSEAITERVITRCF